MIKDLEKMRQALWMIVEAMRNTSGEIIRKLDEQADKRDDGSYSRKMNLLDIDMQKNLEEAYSAIQTAYYCVVDFGRERDEYLREKERRS